MRSHFTKPLGALRFAALALGVAATVACGGDPSDSELVTVSAEPAPSTAPPQTTTTRPRVKVSSHGPITRTSTTTTTAATPPPAPAPTSSTVPAVSGDGSSSVESLVRQVFGAEASTALRVFRCESGLSPSAVSPTNDHGVAQINATTWNKPGHHDPVADWIGRHWGSVYDPHTNLLMAKKIRDAYGWRMWACYD